VVITIYSDRSFPFITRTPPVPVLIKRAVNLAKGPAEPNKNRVGKLTLKQVEEIGRIKMPDLNSFDLEGVMNQGEGHGAADGRGCGAGDLVEEMKPAINANERECFLGAGAC
jgi:large subunit ribosomal protein L11